MRYLKLVYCIIVITFVLYGIRPIESFIRAMIKSSIVFLEEFKYWWKGTPEDKKLYSAVIKTFKKK